MSEYTGLSFKQLEKMNVFEYWLYLRDAVIYRYNKTESGREYLKKCWILEQTKPDRATLREKFGRR